MKKLVGIIQLMLFVALMPACNTASEESGSAGRVEMTNAGQANVQDDVSMKDVVKIAVSSKEHTTLVAALKQAELVDVLANPGPFTVFAPTDAAFNKLPGGTVAGLMNDDKKAELQDILQYHVTTSSLKAESFYDGQVLGMVNGGSVKITVKDGKVILNDNAVIIGSAKASNGMVHIIDGVLLPFQKYK